MVPRFTQFDMEINAPEIANEQTNVPSIGHNLSTCQFIAPMQQKVEDTMVKKTPATDKH